MIMVSEIDLHPILPGSWCVPAAIQCLTGADYLSVIHPSLNRHMDKALLGLVVEASMQAAEACLKEMGYTVRRYKHRADPHRHQIKTWAARSAERYPGRALLVAAERHCLVIKDGLVYDTWMPHGVAGREHPFNTAVVYWCALVERSEK